MCPIEDEVADVVHGETTSMKLTFIAMSLLASSVSMDADMAGDVVAVEERDPPVKLSDTCPCNIPSEPVSSRLEPIEGHSWCINTPEEVSEDPSTIGR